MLGGRERQRAAIRPTWLGDARSPTLAAIAIAAISGAIVAIGYRPGEAFDSLARIELSSLGGRIARALHAWSGLLLGMLLLAQAASVFLGRRPSGRRGERGRALLAIMLAAGLLWGGAMLRADGMGQPARALAIDLVARLPYVGVLLAVFLLGDLTLVYAQHVALAILLALLVRERIGPWPSSRAFARALGSLLVLSLFLSLAAPFRLRTGAIEAPSSAVSRRPDQMRAPLPWATLPPETLPLTAGRSEGCVGCHAGVRGLSGPHDPYAIGCATCHLGDPLRPDAAGAHRGLLRVPGNLDTVGLTCGRAGCHGAIASRVLGSLMATGRGLVAVDRWALGERPTPDGTASLDQLGRSPADSHLRQLCASCHLAAPKTAPAPTSELSRGGGCVACHLDESSPGARARKGEFFHPGLSLRVSDDHCFGCHSRSGRISLSYAGLYEASPPTAARKLADGRVVARADEDVHHARGLACIDCHTAQETMGDGRTHLHEEAATHVRCTTCHHPQGTSPRALPRDSLDAEAAAIVRLRGGERADTSYLVEDRSGEVLTHAHPRPDGTVELRGKLDGRIHVATRPSHACSAISGHARLSCQSCHSAWAPRCVGCHTQADSDGKWVEYAVAPAIAPPALGLLVRNSEARIEPFVPGMVMTWNGPDTAPGGSLPLAATSLFGPSTRFRRAWAFAAPHTITRAGRSCRSCHLSPAALGWGQGRLRLEDQPGGPRWRFEPAFEASRFDGLPGDAWIGFLADPADAQATRTAGRPLDLAAQRRTLRAGACMTCHDPERERTLYERFGESLMKRSARCRVPE